MTARHMYCLNVIGICLLVACFCYGENVKHQLRYNDCDDVVRSGQFKGKGSYIVYLNGSQPLEVYCRFDSTLNATATTIMQQKYGRVSFQRGWNDYKLGFGSMNSGDYWLGLKGMRILTNSGHRILIVTLQDWTNTFRTLQYNYFFLDSANQQYKLHIGGYASSHVLPDDFSHNNGMPFATSDRPDHNNCAMHQKAGWWYNYCTYTLPTGKRYLGGHYTPSGGYYDGIYYEDWHGFGYSLKYIKMELVRQ